MRVIRKPLIVCVLVALSALRIVHAQSLEALAEKFVAASDADRVDMAAAHPELRDEKFRHEITGKGSAALRRGEFALGEKYHQSVLWLANHFDDDGIRAVAFANLASVYGQRGDFATAQRYAVDGIQVAERIDDLESIQSSSANLGIIQRRLGDIDGALASFDRALALAEQLNQVENAARVVNNIGLAYADLGNLAMARDYVARSLAMKQKLPDSPAVSRDVASGLNNVGMLYALLGDYSQSLDYYQRALTLAEKVGGPTLTSAVSNIGQLYLQMSDGARAREQFTRAMTIAEGHGDKSRIATIHYLLGSLERDAGRYAEAEVIHRRSLAIREETGETIGLVESLTELSSLALIGARAADAHALGSRAVNIATAARLWSRLWKAQWVTADALAALKRDDEAMALYQAGIDGIETIRQLALGGSRGQQQYLGKSIGPFHGLARLHAANGRPFDALLALELGRARTLLDVLTTSRRSTHLLTPAQKTRERELTQAVLSASTEMDNLVSRGKYDPAQLAEIETRLSRARLARDAYTTELYTSAPDFRIARGDAPIITRDELNALVKPATAIVSLVLDNTRSWAYVITRNSGGVSVVVREIPATSAELAALADRFASQVATRDLGFAANARKLYDLLFVATKIEPMLNGKSRLVIVPDGPLWRVPFQALQTPRDTFLIEERAVQYSPSVSALAALERRRQSRVSRDPYLVALGDPAIVPAKSSNSGRKAFGRLPQAAREVNALGSLYGGTKSRVLVGDQATEGALRDSLGRATVVHVATHGVLDDISPMYSHLMLAPSGGKNSESDGRLEAWELMDQPLNVDLAVLSACETARGPVGDGEGVMGLSWSLFAAGASTAVVSQWEVDSASTTALMITFHERLLLSGKGGATRSDTPEALRVAAMRLMRTPAYRHPFYWAGFVVVGAH